MAEKRKETLASGHQPRDGQESTIRPYLRRLLKLPVKEINGGVPLPEGDAAALSKPEDR